MSLGFQYGSKVRACLHRLRVAACATALTLARASAEQGRRQVQIYQKIAKLERQEGLY
jgi:hypothetical protein